jgi:hypothetical protein
MPIFAGSTFISDVRDETAKVPKLSRDLSGSAFRLISNLP